MTFDQYIQNPMGGRNAVVSARDMYRKMYQEKWDAILLRENGKIDYALYKDSSDFYVFIKIPSEVVPNFYYDVVIRFYPPKEHKATLLERNLTGYEVQFFSNDPSFVFTFAYAFRKNGLLIKDLEPRLGAAAKERAEQRNPNSQVGYVKSLYFAYLEIKRQGLFEKTAFDRCLKYDKRRLLDQITPANIKIDDRQREGAKLNKKEKKNDSFSKKAVEDIKKDYVRIKGIEPIRRITSSISKHSIKPISKISKISAKSKKR